MGKQLKKQTDITKKEYQGLNQAFKFDKKEGDETINKDDKKPILKMYKKLDIMHDDFTNMVTLKNMILLI